MKKEIDFSKGIRGKFYRGDNPFQVIINVNDQKAHPRFEVYLDQSAAYRFRLADDKHVILVSDEFPSKDACLQAITELKKSSILAPTVFA